MGGGRVKRPLAKPIVGDDSTFRVIIALSGAGESGPVVVLKLGSLYSFGGVICSIGLVSSAFVLVQEQTYLSDIGPFPSHYQ
jgi:hypothetical protein